jgi:hypothetical protein
VTVTSTVPADWAGEVAVIEVAELTVKLVAATDPKLTAVAPVKLVPVMVTDVPPAVIPRLGLTLVTVVVVALVFEHGSVPLSGVLPPTVWKA